MAKPEETQDEPQIEIKEKVEAHKLHIWQIQAVRDLLVTASIFGIFWAGYALRAVSIPLLVALMLAYLFEPLVDRLCKHPRINRPRAVGGILAMGGFSVLLVLSLALPLIIGQTASFVSEVRSGEFQADAARLGKYVPDAFRSEFDNVLKLLPGDAKSEQDDQTNLDQNSELQSDQSLPDTLQAAGGITEQQLDQMKSELRSELLAELSPDAAEDSGADILTIAKNSAPGKSHDQYILQWIVENLLRSKL